MYKEVVRDRYITQQRNFKVLSDSNNSPRQLAFIGHVIVWFRMRYAFRVVRLGLLRNVASSFFQTYVIAVCSYDTVTFFHFLYYHTNVSL